MLDEPGRYIVAGLPCHIQGLRLAQRRSGRLRKRVVATLGIFCGLTNEPRATEYAARRAGLDPASLAEVSYRGPGWPGCLRLETRDGAVRWRPYPDYFEPPMWALMPPRCRICPDTLAELADISVGDAWLERFEGSDGVNDLVVRTPAGERLLAALAGRLVLEKAGPVEMVQSQAESYHTKLEVGRGRFWLRARAAGPSPTTRASTWPPARGSGLGPGRRGPGALPAGPVRSALPAAGRDTLTSRRPRPRRGAPLHRRRPSGAILAT